MDQAPKNSIAKLRRRKSWSQQELAIRAGLHVQTVSEAERSYRGDPSDDTWEALAGALGVTVDELRAIPKPEEAPAAAS